MQSFWGQLFVITWDPYFSALAPFTSTLLTSNTFFNSIRLIWNRKWPKVSTQDAWALALSSALCFQLFSSKKSAASIKLTIPRQNFYLPNFLSLIAGILILNENMYTLLLGRIIQGICTGIYTSIVTLTVKEFAPVEASGSLGAIKLIMNYVGCLLPTFLVYFVDNSD